MTQIATPGYPSMCVYVLLYRDKLSAVKAVGNVYGTCVEARLEQLRLEAGGYRVAEIVERRMERV